MEATLTRTTIIDRLKDELGHSVETDILIEHLWELWETRDMLVKAFGPKRAHALINAPSFIPSPIGEVILI